MKVLKKMVIRKRVEFDSDEDYERYLNGMIDDVARFLKELTATRVKFLARDE